MRTRALWRLDEVNAAQRPIDAIGAVAELYQSPTKFGSPQRVRDAIGWGIVTDGWHCNEASGNMLPAFGATTLTAGSTPSYGNQGPRGGSDKAIGIDSFSDGFVAPNNSLYDVGASDDLFLAWVGKWHALPTYYGAVFSKASGSFANGWTVTGTDGTGFTFAAGAGAAYASSLGATYMQGHHHAGIAAIDRVAATIRFAIMSLRDGTVALGNNGSIAAVSISSAIPFAYGYNGGWVGGNDTFHLSQLYLGKGVGYATGTNSNISTALANFASAVLSTPAVVDAAAGRGRSFVALSGHGFEGADTTSGATLFTREASVQVLMRWDLADQAAATSWSITKLLAGAWDAGASSVETIAGDGFVEFVVDGSTPTARVILGLSATDPDAGFSSIQFALYVNESGAGSNLQVYESGVSKFTLAVGNADGDVLRVQRVGTTVTYWKNGTLLYTSLTSSSGALRIDSTTLNAATPARGIYLSSAGSRTAITWQNITGVTLTPAANTGTLYARGKATAAAEYLGAGVELRVANASQGVGELRWLWQTSGGTLKRQVGGYFAPPTDGSYMLLTATRRWVSSTKVILRYFLGDRLLAEIESADGDIGGGTTGTTMIGARFDGTKWGDFLDGVIDELRVVDYELTPEEIEATWKRISVLQPRGYRAMRDMFPPDAPISDNPSSRIQRLLNLAGNAVGYAAAQVENLRQNLLPDRAYGSTLEQWEGIAKEPARALDSVDTRRARVVGHLRQRAGFLLTGLLASLSGVVATATSNLEILTFAQEFIEGYDKTDLWSYDILYRAAASSIWTATAGLLSVNAPASSAALDSSDRNWCTAALSIPHSSIFKIKTNELGLTPGVGLSAHMLTKIAPTTLPSRAEVGIAFHDAGRGHTLLVGLRNNNGTYQIITEKFVGGVTTGATVRATTALQAHWLQLYHDGPAPIARSLTPYDGSTWNFVAGWSTTSATAGFTNYSITGHPSLFHWATLYFRTFDVGGSKVPGSSTVVDFDDTRLWAPFGDRPFSFYVYRNPSLSGTPDLGAAHGIIQGLKQAQAQGTIITTKSFFYDDPRCVYDRGPLGGF